MQFKKAVATAVLGIGLGVAAPAMVSSAAFAQGASVSPKVVAPGGSITATVNCPGGGNASVQALWGMASGQAQPNGTKQVTLKNGSATFSFSIPGNTRSGSYSVGAFCPNAGSATMTGFTVAPGGAPRGGDGGKVDNSVTLAAGTALLGAAAAGMVMMRRRSQATN